MKITDPEIIRTGERELIEAVKGDLDWDTIGEIVKQRINISSINSTSGEIVVHENQVAFRIDFMLKMDLSLMFDRDGVLIPDRDEDQANGVVESSEQSSEDGMVKTSEPPPAEQEISSWENQGDQTPPGPEAENQETLDIEHPDFDLSDLDLAVDVPKDDEVGEALDDDIDEILKESRDFWENKKNE